jgi:phosphoribosylformylglycinamidine synthase
LLATAEPEVVREILEAVPCTVIGKVGGDVLEIRGKDFDISLSLEEILEAYGSFTRFMVE